MPLQCWVRDWDNTCSVVDKGGGPGLEERVCSEITLLRFPGETYVSVLKEDFDRLSNLSDTERAI